MITESKISNTSPEYRNFAGFYTQFFHLQNTDNKKKGKIDNKVCVYV